MQPFNAAGYGRSARPDDGHESWEALTWGDLDQKAMKYKFGDHIPFKRAFGFHQAEAYHQAKKWGCLPANFNLEDAAKSQFSTADQQQRVRSIAIFSQ